MKNLEIENADRRWAIVNGFCKSHGLWTMDYGHKARKLTVILLLCAITFLFAPACDTSPYKQGKKLYETHCQNCHQEDGNALMGLIPPLAGSDYLMKHQDELPCLIRYGMNEEIMVNGILYQHEMPGNEVLTETQIANVINYVNNAWGNEAAFVSYDTVMDGLKKCNK